MDDDDYDEEDLMEIDRIEKNALCEAGSIPENNKQDMDNRSVLQREVKLDMPRMQHYPEKRCRH
ncbi:uncharacterized protein LOC120555273 [Xyrichtys novacula]|uniref:Uncharacterized protein LOC120555273 n=1 Tax=Xyrichtys novacula TaxID=13765 RepID=A0AAV1FL20_XYRNO|nr:uncharacterized protein LOC120555273 [Xyrichtys novacula]